MSKDTELLSSAKALNSRVKQKEQEQASAERNARDADNQRYWLTMSSMVRVRKAMREMQALDLGERFFFGVEHQEVEGWPELSLRLQDSDTLDANFPAVKVLALIKDGQGIIEVCGHEKTDVQHIDLSHKLDVTKVANTLKETIKTYLDFVGDVIEAVISNGESPDSYSSKPVPTNSKPENAEINSLGGGDLFVEDELGSDFLETASSDDEIEALPSFDN